MLPTFKTKMEFVRWFFTQVLLTFSNQESFFSSKRIERFMIFMNANIALDICIHYLLKTGKMDYIAAVAIYSAQMIYAGYQTKQIFNEKVATTASDTDTNSIDTSTTTYTTSTEKTSIPTGTATGTTTGTTKTDESTSVD